MNNAIIKPGTLCKRKILNRYGYLTGWSHEIFMYVKTEISWKRHDIFGKYEHIFLNSKGAKEGVLTDMPFNEWSKENLFAMTEHNLNSYLPVTLREEE